MQKDIRFRKLVICTAITSLAKTKCPLLIYPCLRCQNPEYIRGYARLKTGIIRFDFRAGLFKEIKQVAVKLGAFAFQHDAVNFIG